jgi:hypothetical protein
LISFFYTKVMKNLSWPGYVGLYDLRGKPADGANEGSQSLGCHYVIPIKWDVNPPNLYLVG